MEQDNIQGYNAQEAPTPVSQPVNTVPPVSNEAPKKKNTGLIVGALAAVAVIVAGVIFVPKMFSSSSSDKEDNNESSISNPKGPVVVVGGKEVTYQEGYSEDKNTDADGQGLFKIGDEYIYKGGNFYLKYDNAGNELEEAREIDLKNVVKFNNHYWRIMRINADGSIRLVYYGDSLEEGKVRNGSEFRAAYFNVGTTNYTYENSNLRAYLNSTFLNNTEVIPANYADYLVKSKWDTSKYNIYGDEISSEISTFEDYVGVISIKERSNAEYCYSAISSYGYKIRPCENYIDNILGAAATTKQLDTNTSNVVFSDEGEFRCVADIGRSNGEYVVSNDYDVYSEYHGYVLPVINLSPNVKFASGDGSVENPFVVK